MNKNKIIYDIRRSSITSIIAIIVVMFFANEACAMVDKTSLVLSALGIITVFFILLWLNVFRPAASCSSCNNNLDLEIDKNYKVTKTQGEAKSLQSCPHCGVTFEAQKPYNKSVKQTD